MTCMMKKGPGKRGEQSTLSLTEGWGLNHSCDVTGDPQCAQQCQQISSKEQDFKGEVASGQVSSTVHSGGRGRQTSINSRPAGSTWQVLGWPALHSKTLSIIC